MTYVLIDEFVSSIESLGLSTVKHFWIYLTENIISLTEDRQKPSFVDILF